MDFTTHPLAYWLALWRIPGIGAIRYAKLLEHFGTPEHLFAASPVAQKQCGLKNDQLALLAAPPSLNGSSCAVPLWQGVKRDLQWLEASDQHHIIRCTDADFPRLLAELPGAPPLLFVRGNLHSLQIPQIAMVGSRHPSRQGFDNARSFAAHFAQQGLAVTSGLALGIDTGSHQGALEVDGCSIAVLAHGLDQVFPARNRPLADKLLERGALVSEFPIGVQPKPNLFPRRNRIISGMSMGVLVVEAAVKSGSLITAKEALQQNREVFAIPGSLHNPLSKGCHALIRQGATLVETGQHVMEQVAPLLAMQRQQLQLCLDQMNDAESAGSLSVGSLEASTQYPAGSAQREILNVLDGDPMSIDEIVVRTGLNVADINAALLLLELDDAVVNTNPGYTLATPA